MQSDDLMSSGKKKQIVQQLQQLQQLSLAASLEEIRTLGGLLAASGYFPDVKSQAQAVVKILAGRELGIPPMAAMMGVNVIEGKTSLGANLIAARLRQMGFDWRLPYHDIDGCVLELVRPDGFICPPVEFKKADADRAMLLSKLNWRKYPKAMYFARCITIAARTFAPEVFSGIPIYTDEELAPDMPCDENAAQIKQTIEAAPVSETALAVVTQQQQPTPEVTTLPAAPQNQKGKFDVMVKAISGTKDAIGETLYYRTLREFNVEHSNQFKSMNDARECYKQLAGYVRLHDYSERVGADALRDVLQKNGYETIGCVPNLLAINDVLQELARIERQQKDGAK